jgi:hypothetical protein
VSPETAELSHARLQPLLRGATSAARYAFGEPITDRLQPELARRLVHAQESDRR